jgi:hypothetical protein
LRKIGSRDWRVQTVYAHALCSRLCRAFRAWTVSPVRHASERLRRACTHRRRARSLERSTSPHAEVWRKRVVRAGCRLGAGRSACHAAYTCIPSCGSEPAPPAALRVFRALCEDRRGRPICSRAGVSGRRIYRLGGDRGRPTGSVWATSVLFRRTHAGVGLASTSSCGRR